LRVCQKVLLGAIATFVPTVTIVVP